MQNHSLFGFYRNIGALCLFPISIWMILSLYVKTEHATFISNASPKESIRRMDNVNFKVFSAQKQQILSIQALVWETPLDLYKTSHMIQPSFEYISLKRAPCLWKIKANTASMAFSPKSHLLPKKIQYKGNVIAAQEFEGMKRVFKTEALDMYPEAGYMQSLVPCSIEGAEGNLIGEKGIWASLSDQKMKIFNPIFNKSSPLS